MEQEAGHGGTKGPRVRVSAV